MKTDSRMRVGGTIHGTAERFLEAQRVGVVVIIVVVPPEQPIPRLFVARNGSGVVVVDFQPHNLAAPPHRSFFHGRKEQGPDASPFERLGNSI